MLRVKERLQNSLLPYDTKFPILLNKNSLLVRAIIIFDCHRKVIPSGLKDTLNELRCNFWVIQGRRVVKSVIRKCLMLKQQSKRFGVLSMAPLPQFRVNFTFPFCYTGVDFMSVICKECISQQKWNNIWGVHIVVYTCANSRAIRLDIVADAGCYFIRSLKRFISVNDVRDLYMSECKMLYRSRTERLSFYVIN